MSSMEVEVSYTPSKFAADNALSNPDNVEMYKTAASVVNAVLPEILDKINVGASIHDLCKLGDELLESHAKSMYKKYERGIAFPTCISVNNHVQYVSPLPDSDYTLQPGDVVKIELGAHVNGYIATCAHTTILNPTPQEPVLGPAADAVCAAHFALEAALRMLRPGVKSSEITRVITEIAAYYRCQPVEGTYSSPMKRFVLRAGKDIENRFVDDLTVQELAKFDFEIETNQVYQLNIVVATGDGRVKTAEFKPTVFQRDVNQSYQLKLDAARKAFNEINKNYTVFPFSARALPSHLRIGLSSLESHGLITPYTPMRTRQPSDIVAQFKATVLVTPNGILRTTNPMPLPFVHSQYCIPLQTTAANVLSQINI